MAYWNHAEVRERQVSVKFEKDDDGCFCADVVIDLDMITADDTKRVRERRAVCLRIPLREFWRLSDQAEIPVSGITIQR